MCIIVHCVNWSCAKCMHENIKAKASEVHKTNKNITLKAYFVQKWLAQGNNYSQMRLY